MFFYFYTTSNFKNREKKNFGLVNRETQNCYSWTPDGTPPLAPPQWMQHQTDQRKYILLLIDGIYLHLISSEVAGGNYWCLHCLLQPSFLHFVQAPRYNYWLYSYSHSRLSGSPLSLYYNYCKSPTLLSETEKKKNRLNFHGNNRWMRESAASK